MQTNHTRHGNQRVSGSVEGAGRMPHLPRSAVLLFVLLLALAAISACGRGRQRPAAQEIPPTARLTQLAAAQSTDSPTGAEIANLGDTGQALCKRWDTPKAPVTPGYACVRSCSAMAATLSAGMAKPMFSAPDIAEM